MKRRSLYALSCLIALSAGVGMFLLKYHVLDKEKELTQVYRQIRSAEHELHILSAEWAYHTDPARLRQLAQQLNLSSVLGRQIVQPQKLTNRPAPVPAQKPKFEEGKNDV